MILTRLKKVNGLIYASIVILLAFSIFAPGFLSQQNVELILKNSAILMVVSIGMTMAILSQQVDLSIGGTMSLAGLIAAYYVVSCETITAGSILLTLLIGAAVGAAVGLFNGLLIGRLKFNYWLATFATMSITFGLALGLSDGKIVSGYDKMFRKGLCSGTQFLGIPNLIWISVVICILMLVVIRKTRFGYHLYAVGDSEQCANLSGIDVTRVRSLTFMLSGIFAGLGGVLLIAKTNSASSQIGSGYEFDAIAACVIGGTSFEGGKGGLGGTVLGALILAAFKSGLQLIGLNNYWQKAFVGVFILAIIVVDVLSAQKREKNAERRVYK